MTLIDALVIAAVLCLMENNNCRKREKIWRAINNLDNRKMDLEP